MRSMMESQLSVVAGLVVVPRLTLGATRRSGGVIDPAWWGETALLLPESSPASFANLLTSRRHAIGRSAQVAELLNDFPVGLWING